MNDLDKDLEHSMAALENAKSILEKEQEDLKILKEQIKQRNKKIKEVKINEFKTKLLIGTIKVDNAKNKIGTIAKDRKEKIVQGFDKLKEIPGKILVYAQVKDYELSNKLDEIEDKLLEKNAEVFYEKEKNKEHDDYEQMFTGLINAREEEIYEQERAAALEEKRRKQEEAILAMDEKIAEVKENIVQKVNTTKSKIGTINNKAKDSIISFSKNAIIDAVDFGREVKLYHLDNKIKFLETKNRLKEESIIKKQIKAENKEIKEQAKQEKIDERQREYEQWVSEMEAKKAVKAEIKQAKKEERQRKVEDIKLNVTQKVDTAKSFLINLPSVVAEKFAFVNQNKKYYDNETKERLATIAQNKQMYLDMKNGIEQKVIENQEQEVGVSRSRSNRGNITNTILIIVSIITVGVIVASMMLLK